MDYETPISLAKLVLVCALTFCGVVLSVGLSIAMLRLVFGMFIWKKFRNLVRTC